MTVAELAASVQQSQPPAHLAPAALALWHTKKGNWDKAHDIAQVDHSHMGSWIHALLHLIEGDTGNAGYWFHQARKPVRNRAEIDSLWDEIATELLEA